MIYTGANVDGFIEYNEARGREIPGTTDPALIEASLLLASEWIDNTYGRSFIGKKTNGYEQEREWPRINAVIPDPRYGYIIPDNVIPAKVISAVYEAAYRNLITPGSLLVDYTPGKYKSVSIEGAISVDYAQFSSSQDVQKTFPIIDQLLSDFMSLDAGYSSYSSSAVRA